MEPDHSAERPVPRPRIFLQSSAFRISLLVLSPVLVVALVLWWLLGLVLTLSPLVVAASATIVTWALYLSIPGIPVGLVDWPIVFTLGYGLIAFAPTRSKLVHLGLWIALLVYALCRSQLRTADGETEKDIVDSLTTLGCIWPLWLVVCRLKLWLQADEEILEDVETKIYKQFITSEFTIDKVAGMGTVHVPYCGDSTRLPPRTLVLVHGYLAGNATWAANLQTLAKFFNVYAVEWKGIGRSDRPTFKPKTEEEMDDFYVESLEDWRRALQLERFVLCAHSMGAMYSTYYAEKYAQHIEHLLLVSPAGVTASEQSWDDLPVFIRIFARHYVTPMSFVRFAGPLGPSMVGFFLRKRAEWTADTNIIRSGAVNFDHMSAYFYHNYALKPSGDIALYTHLHPGARAQRRPLNEALAPARITVPLTIFYGGGDDWMPAEHGEAVIRSLEKTHYAMFRLVPHAGHQVFMDNPSDFNQMVIEAVHDHERAVASGATSAHLMNNTRPFQHYGS